MTKPSPKQKVRKVKAWAVLMNGRLVNEGWGWHSKWIFRRKWNAKDAIEEEQLAIYGRVTIVPCVISYLQ